MSMRNGRISASAGTGCLLGRGVDATTLSGIAE
jgi:hypothetical protein